MTTDMIGKVLIFISEETDICCWLLSNQTGTAERAMTSIFFPLNFSFCYLTALCFHCVLEEPLQFLRLLTEGSDINSATVSFSFLAHTRCCPFTDITTHASCHCNRRCSVFKTSSFPFPFLIFI